MSLTALHTLPRRGRVLGAAAAFLVAIAFVQPETGVGAASPPAGLTALSQDGAVALAWQSSGSATGYDVLRGSSPGSVSTVVASAVTGTTYTDATAVNGTTYYYAVREAGDPANPLSNVAGATPRAATCSAGNAIVHENCFPGTTDWKLTNAGPAPAGIEGYATRTSVNAGDSLNLKVNTAAGAQYHIEIYRTGYYGGAQARLISTLPVLTGIAQDPCVRSTDDTGLLDCGNWRTDATISTSAAWPTGVYLARLVREDNATDNHILFVVRHDGDHAPVSFRLPDSSYEAYNNYGGKSLYDFNSSGGTTVAGTTRAVKVSYNRPYVQSNINDRNWYTSSDIEAVSWLEQQGYDIDYVSTLDVDSGADAPADHRIAVSGVHDEYWSAALRQASVAARDSGTSLVFLGGNAAYWRIRLEASPVTGADARTEVCYKTTQGGVADPVSPTTTWRDPAGANAPENALLGQMYIGDNDSVFFPLRVSAAEGKNRFWRHTGLDTQAAGATAAVGKNLVGWEWDQRFANGQEPPGVQVLATSPVTGDLLTDAGRVTQAGSTSVTSTVYRASSGALVWATGTNHWSRGLARNMAGVGEPNAIVQQATLNMLADMGVRPTTPAAGLVVDQPGPWSVTSRSPVAGAAAVATTAAVKATFDRSVDPSTLTTQSFTLTGPGGASVPASVAYDDATRTATLTPSQQLDGNTAYTATLSPSITTWTGDAPASADSWSFTTGSGLPPSVTSRSPAPGATGVSSGTTVRVTFDRSIDPATLTAQSFSLKSAAGETVAATPTWDGASRTATLTPSARLAGNTQYTATLTTAITANDGTPMTAAVSWSFTTAPALTVTNRFPAPLASGVSPSTDVRVTFSRAVDPATVTGESFSLVDGSGGAVPATVSYDASSRTAQLLPAQPLLTLTGYTATVTTAVRAADGEPLSASVSWTFTTAATPPPAPAPSTLQPAGGATGVPLGASIQATFDRALDGATVTPQSFVLRDAGGTVQAATVSYDAAAQTATLAPSAQLQPGARYTATLTTAIRSTTGAPMASDVSWSFTAANCPCSLMANLTPASTGLPVRDGRPAPGPWTYELGTKIVVDQPMTLTAIRFYKDAAETGTHVGTVWSPSGAVLARVTFGSETASGWQQQGLPAPLALAAGTIYTVSVGFNNTYASTQNGLLNPLFAGPLRTVADGNNGVLGSSAGTFPTASFRSTNYFVDALVRTPTSQPPAPGVTATSPVADATGVSPATKVRATFDIALDPATVNAQSFTLADSTGAAVPATVSYDAANQAAVLTPSSPLANSTAYTARVGTGVRSTEGAALSAPVSWTFTTAAPSPPVITATSPADGATQIGSAATVRATFSTAIDPSTLTAETVTLTSADGAALPGTVGYDPTTRTATFTPASRLSPSTTYTARFAGSIMSAQGVAMGADATFLFTTAACPCSLYAPTAVPASTRLPTKDGRSGVGPWSYELGTKIQVSSPVDLTAIRFYKSPGETGTHVGTVWSATGTVLGRVTFTGETASGWQQQALATPVTLAPGQKYIVSVGLNAFFVMTRSGLASQITSGPLASVADGQNGVFGGSAGTFPTGSFSSSSYFVDAVVR